MKLWQAGIARQRARTEFQWPRPGMQVAIITSSLSAVTRPFIDHHEVLYINGSFPIEDILIHFMIALVEGDIAFAKSIR
jgi:hypothetical protein